MDDLGRRMTLTKLLAVGTLVVACQPQPIGETSNPGHVREQPAADLGQPITDPTLYFLEIRTARLLTLPAVGGELRTLRSGPPSAAPDGIAIDPVRGHLYWTNMGRARQEDGFILRSDLDGSNLTTLIPAGATHTPKQLKLEPREGKLYWADREGMRIQRANLDGSQLETLISVATGDAARADPVNHCVGIAVDVGGGWFYWTQKGPRDAGLGTIKRARIVMPPGAHHRTRTDVETLFAGLSEPIDLEIDPKAGYLYWTDRGDDTINRAPLALSPGATPLDRTDREVLVRDVVEAIGIALDLDRNYLYYTGLGGQIGRARLDGSDAEELLSDQGPLVGIAVGG